MHTKRNASARQIIMRAKTFYEPKFIRENTHDIFQTGHLFKLPKKVTNNLNLSSHIMHRWRWINCVHAHITLMFKRKRKWFRNWLRIVRLFHRFFLMKINPFSGSDYLIYTLNVKQMTINIFMEKNCVITICVLCALRDVNL